MVNTFVPVADVNESLRYLDDRRLNKQISECVSILGAIFDLPTIKGTPRKGYKNHPAQKMWEGYESGLLDYFASAIRVWQGRGGGIDNYHPPRMDADRNVYWVHSYKVLDEVREHRHYLKDSEKVPYWMGHEPTHASHRSNLLRKDPVHYGKFGWTEPPNLPYIWPNHYGFLEALPTMEDLYKAAEFKMEMKDFMKSKRKSYV